MELDGQYVRLPNLVKTGVAISEKFSFFMQIDEPAQAPGHQAAATKQVQWNRRGETDSQCRRRHCHEQFLQTLRKGCMTIDLEVTLTSKTLVAAPVLLAALLVGLLVSMFQVVTQIQEMSLSFVPKLLAVVAVLVIAGS
jgi:flagellar biosynthesis protein FliQ